MKNLRVLLVDDHPIVRKGIRSLLENETGIDVVGEAENGKEAIKKVEGLTPDVVVMDISMPLLNGLDATRQIKRRFPEVRVLILTMHSNEEYISEILKAGASGYLVKKAVPEELVSAIHAVSQGNSFLSPSVSKSVIKKFLQVAGAEAGLEKSSLLTEREREVLQLIAEGHSNRKIAEMLFISVKTIEAHRSHIMEKLELHNLADLTRFAIRIGIISPER
ncbi:MAG: response regulator transcription factor [Methanosarcinaceae archaeon]|nr:response regulator transcription factor [Methanosarcinaceae archaeon]